MTTGEYFLPLFTEFHLEPFARVRIFHNASKRGLALPPCNYCLAKKASNGGACPLLRDLSIYYQVDKPCIVIPELKPSLNIF